MSQVYAARDQLLDRDVAVKVFGPAVDAAGPERQRAEMRTLAQLSHPRLVALHDAGSDRSSDGRDHAFLVMELIDGPSLADVLHARPLTPKQTARIGAGVADALDYIHGRGVIHRDVKPANILLNGAPETGGEPHLADFGIAQTLGESALTQTGLTIGTAAYLSPEQVRGASAGPASDIYALGLVLLECLTGRREYPGVTAESALARLTRPPVIDPGLPQPWPALLTAMTDPDPQLRPSAAEVAFALETGFYGAAALATGTPSAPPTTVLASPVAPVAVDAVAQGESGDGGAVADEPRTRLLTSAIPAPPEPMPRRVVPVRGTTTPAAALPPLSHRTLAIAGAALVAVVLVVLAVSSMGNTGSKGNTGTVQKTGTRTGADSGSTGQDGQAGPVRLKPDLDRLRQLVTK